MLAHSSGALEDIQGEHWGNNWSGTRDYEIVQVPEKRMIDFVFHRSSTYRMRQRKNYPKLFSLMTPIHRDARQAKGKNFQRKEELISRRSTKYYENTERLWSGLTS